ncbi:MAG: hypothetical protein R3E32_25270 [Chitinophagales bacterium]
MPNPFNKKLPAVKNAIYQDIIKCFSENSLSDLKTDKRHAILKKYNLQGVFMNETSKTDFEAVSQKDLQVEINTEIYKTVEEVVENVNVDIERNPKDNYLVTLLKLVEKYEEELDKNQEKENPKPPLKVKTLNGGYQLTKSKIILDLTKANYHNYLTLSETERSKFNFAYKVLTERKLWYVSYASFSQYVLPSLKEEDYLLLEIAEIIEPSEETKHNYFAHSFIKFLKTKGKITGKISDDNHFVDEEYLYLYQFMGLQYKETYKTDYIHFFKPHKGKSVYSFFIEKGMPTTPTWYDHVPKALWTVDSPNFISEYITHLKKEAEFLKEEKNAIIRLQYKHQKVQFKEDSEILFLAACPQIDKLTIEKEENIIDEQIKTKYKPELTPSGLWNFFQKPGTNYPIIHFSGHGSPNGHLVLNSDRHPNQPESTSHYGIRNLFKLINQDFHIECVVLNACFSSEQAKKIAETGIPYVIGVNHYISAEKTAIPFSKAYYKALKNKKCYEQAFLEACNKLDISINKAQESQYIIYINSCKYTYKELQKIYNRV